MRSALCLSLLSLSLLASSAAAQDVDCEARIAGLAAQIEGEMDHLRGQTAAFGRVPVLRRQEHWYRPWQENAIVQVMDRALDNFDTLLLTELVDLKGRLAAVNAHAGSGEPLATGGLYLLDYSRRPWFAALTEGGALARLDGPGVDPDLERVYGEAAAGCLRVTVPIQVDGETVALLSHCFRSTLLTALLDDDAEIALALFDASGRLIAGRDLSVAGEPSTRGVSRVLSADASQTWTLQAFPPERRGLRAWLGGMSLPVSPDRLAAAGLGRVPGLVFAASACFLLGLLILARARKRVAGRGATQPAAYATERRILVPAEKAFELLNAALSAMQSTIHLLADGTEDLAAGSPQTMAAEGPGTTLHALRRVKGLRELLAGLERHIQTCRGESARPEQAVSADLRRGLEIFGRIGRQMDSLIEPLRETERRLVALPAGMLRSSGETRVCRELTDNLNKLVGVMSALQGALARIPRAALRGEWSPREGDGRIWERAIGEVHDLLLLLARQVGASTKLLELLPDSATAPAVATASAQRPSSAQGPQTAPQPASRRAVVGGVVELPPARSFEILSGGATTDEPERSARLPSR